MGLRTECFLGDSVTVPFRKAIVQGCGYSGTYADGNRDGLLEPLEGPRVLAFVDIGMMWFGMWII